MGNQSAECGDWKTLTSRAVDRVVFRRFVGNINAVEINTAYEELGEHAARANGGVGERGRAGQAERVQVAQGTDFGIGGHVGFTIRCPPVLGFDRENLVPRVGQRPPARARALEPRGAV